MDNPFTHINFAALVFFLVVSVVVPIVMTVVVPVVLIKKQKKSWAFGLSVVNIVGAIAVFILSAGLIFFQMTEVYVMTPNAAYFTQLLFVGAVVTAIPGIVLTIISGVLWIKA